MADEATDGLVWRLEAVRFPEPVTRWSAALFTSIEPAVVAHVMEETGVLLDGVAAREFDGRVYTAMVPLGGRARTARWLVPVMRRVRPELRRRLAAAHAADVADWSGHTVEEWKGGAETDLLERGHGFLAGDLAALSAQQVAARLEEQLRFVEECFTWRARLHAAGIDAIGRLGLELSRDHGWPVPEIMDLFVGLSGTATDPAVAQLAIVDLVRSEGAMPALERAATLADLTGTSPAVATALQGYQDLWGQRAVRYEVAAPTVVDRPEWLLRQLKGAARAAGDRQDVAVRHAATRTQAEARLIASLGNSSLTRRRLARAQEVFPLREGNGATTVGVPLAGLRRLGLHIGVRLGLYRPEEVFDLTFDEVLQVLRHPDHVSLDEGTDAARVGQLAMARREERERLATKEPPALVGEDAGDDQTGLVPPDLRGFPRAAAEHLAALTWYAAAGSGATRLDVRHRRGAAGHRRLAGHLRGDGPHRARRGRLRAHPAGRRAGVPDHITGVVRGLPVAGCRRVRRRRGHEPRRRHRPRVLHPRSGGDGWGNEHHRRWHAGPRGREVGPRDPAAVGVRSGCGTSPGSRWRPC